MMLFPNDDAPAGIAIFSTHRPVSNTMLYHYMASCEIHVGKKKATDFLLPTNHLVTVMRDYIII